MNFISKLNFLVNFFKLLLKQNSICRIFQTLEFKKLKLKNKTIEFGCKNFKDSFTKFLKLNRKNIFLSDISSSNENNYLKINLQKSINLKKKFENIVIFNVLEHLYDDNNAIKQLSKILKKNGYLIISTPFLYRFHGAPNDFKRYTISYYEKLLSDQNFTIIKKKNLGKGPFLACCSLLYDYLKKIPLLIYPILLISYVLDCIISLFHKSDLTQIYPICIFIIAKKK
tara:strand:- start:1279 stop:1959 length:681 start_codon:yes stop_codon:yes gene_type:complete